MGEANLGLSVCGIGIQLRMMSEVCGVVHIESGYATTVVKSIEGEERQTGPLRAGRQGSPLHLPSIQSQNGANAILL